jgi:Fe2+ transport system protein FeoA
LLPGLPHSELSKEPLANLISRGGSQGFEFFATESQFVIATESQCLHIRASHLMTTTAPKLTLATAQCGVRLRVLHICPDCPHCVRLRELGFHDRTVVTKVVDGNAVICVLLGTRIALGRELCDHVEVERLAA